MSKRQMIIVLGLWAAIFLFLGFPSSWDKAIAAVTGLLIVMFAYSVHPPPRERSDEEMPYVEHRAMPKPPRPEPVERMAPSSSESKPYVQGNPIDSVVSPGGDSSSVSGQ